MIPFNPLLIKRILDKKTESKIVPTPKGFKSAYNSDDSTMKGIIMFIVCILFLGLVAYTMSLKY